MLDHYVPVDTDSGIHKLRVELVHSYKWYRIDEHKFSLREVWCLLSESLKWSMDAAQELKKIVANNDEINQRPIRSLIPYIITQKDLISQDIPLESISFENGCLKIVLEWSMLSGLR